MRVHGPPGGVPGPATTTAWTPATSFRGTSAGGRGLGPEWNDARRVPEKASSAGWFEAVDGASHTTILGQTYGEVAVRGVAHVLAHLPPKG